VSTCTATRPWGRHVAPLARQVMRRGLNHPALIAGLGGGRAEPAAAERRLRLRGTVLLLISCPELRAEHGRRCPRRVRAWPSPVRLSARLFSPVL
jgi:hypothetical protein